MLDSSTDETSPLKKLPNAFIFILIISIIIKSSNDLPLTYKMNSAFRNSRV